VQNDQDGIDIYFVIGYKRYSLRSIISSLSLPKEDILEQTIKLTDTEDTSTTG